MYQPPVIRNAAKWRAFTRWWYLAPNVIISRDSRGASAAASLSQCIWASCPSVCLSCAHPSLPLHFHSTSVSPAAHLPGTPISSACPPLPPPHFHRQLFSTICCHCDQSPFHRTSHLTEAACSKAIPYLVQMNSSTNMWSPPSPMPLPRASISPSPPSLHPPDSPPRLRLEPYLFRCLQKKRNRLSPALASPTPHSPPPCQARLHPPLPPLHSPLSNQLDL